MNRKVPKYLHPISISIYGGTICSLATFIGSPGIYSVGKTLDFADGFIARKYNLQTKIGAIFDPLVDKYSTYFPLAYMYCFGDLELSVFDSIFIGGNILVDYYKQVKRQNPIQTIRDVLSGNHQTEIGISEDKCKANYLGKIKSVSQAIGTGIVISKSSSLFDTENYIKNLSPEIIEIIQTHGIYSCFGIALAFGLMSIPKINTKAKSIVKKVTKKTMLGI